MASFQAKTTWERLRKGENKNYHSDHFLPVTQQRIQKKKKKAKKFNKLKNTIVAFFSSQNRMGKAEKE